MYPRKVQENVSIWSSYRGVLGKEKRNVDGRKWSLRDIANSSKADGFRNAYLLKLALLWSGGPGGSNYCSLALCRLDCERPARKFCPFAHAFQSESRMTKISLKSSQVFLAGFYYKKDQAQVIWASNMGNVNNNKQVMGWWHSDPLYYQNHRLEIEGYFSFFLSRLCIESDAARDFSSFEDFGFLEAFEATEPNPLDDPWFLPINCHLLFCLRLVIFYDLM